MTHLLSASTAALTAAVTDRKGVTAAEYAILAVGIVVAVGAAAIAFQERITAAFATITFAG
jgi:pilus assembly protein Flp/PilA